MGIYMRYPGGKQKALTFSYDDGVEQDARLVKILDEHGMKGTFNLNSGLFAAEGTKYPDGTIHRRMTRAMCAELYQNHEVALHALTHPFLESLSPEKCTYEILQDRINLEKLTGRITRGMAYPFGTYSDAVVDSLKACGIVYSRTTVSTGDFNLPKDWLRLPATCHHNDSQLMELAKKFTELDCNQRPAKMFYLWGHAYEFERNDNWNVIEEFTDFMANRDDIWYATNIEIYDYIHAYDQLLFDVEQTRCTNPTATELWFIRGTELFVVKPGETILL